MQKFCIGFLIVSWIEFVLLKELIWQVISNSSVDLETTDILDDYMRQHPQGFDVFAFGFIIVTEELHLC